jgi:hypothetical protein
MALLFVNAQHDAATVTAQVDHLAVAIFALQYFDSNATLQPLGTSPLVDKFSWMIPAQLLANPVGGLLGLRIVFRPEIQLGNTNLWLRVDQGPATALHAVNHPDPGNVLPPYRACTALNGISTPYEFAIAV